MATGLVHFTSFTPTIGAHGHSRRPSIFDLLPLRPHTPFTCRNKQQKGRVLRHANWFRNCSQDPDSTSSRQKTNKSSICECLVLVKVAEGLSALKAEESVGKLWSAQYMAPGTLCAFGGAQVAASTACPPFTHAVRFRFGSQAAADQFLTNAAVQAEITEDPASTSQRNTVVLFEGRVASDLEAIFCRGSEWDNGAEHAFLLKAAPNATSERIEEYLAQLAALAEGSLAGALQCTYGRIWWSKGDIVDGTHAMLTRFETKMQLQAFLRLPPCVAVADKPDNLPVSAIVSFAYNIAPPKDSRSSAPQSNML